jgi:hypothetical protein
MDVLSLSIWHALVLDVVQVGYRVVTFRNSHCQSYSDLSYVVVFLHVGGPSQSRCAHSMWVRPYVNATLIVSLVSHPPKSVILTTAVKIERTLRVLLRA